jgi:hypothetical protein
VPATAARIKKNRVQTKSPKLIQQQPPSRVSSLRATAHIKHATLTKRRNSVHGDANEQGDQIYLLNICSSLIQFASLVGRLWKMDPDRFSRGKTSNPATGSIQSPQAAQHVCTRRGRRSEEYAETLTDCSFPHHVHHHPRRTEEEHATRQNKSLSSQTWTALLLPPSALSPV